MSINLSVVLLCESTVLARGKGDVIKDALNGEPYAVFVVGGFVVLGVLVYLKKRQDNNSNNNSSDV